MKDGKRMSSTKKSVCGFSNVCFDAYLDICLCEIQQKEKAGR